MQNRFGLLVADVMPIYMIMPRYSHNYALFYQLLDSNLFTHRNTYAILREATSETNGPGSILHHISFWSTLFCNLYFPIYTKKLPKIFTLLSLLDLTFASDREGIDNPFIALVARFLIVCAGTWWLVRCLLLDWYLGSQNWGKYLHYFAASPFPLQGKNQRKLKR